MDVAVPESVRVQVGVGVAVTVDEVAVIAADQLGWSESATDTLRQIVRRTKIARTILYGRNHV